MALFGRTLPGQRLTGGRTMRLTRGMSFASRQNLLPAAGLLPALLLRRQAH